MLAPGSGGATDLTRRQALQAGGAGAAAAVVLLHPWVSAVARAAESSGPVPKYLLRSTWLELSNPYFQADGVTLRLESVGDLASAPWVPSLADSEDAFSLVFSGAGADQLGDGPVRLRHPDLGSFNLYVGGNGGSGSHEAVVNRVLSNTESRRTPPRPPSRPADERSSAASGESPGQDVPGQAKHAKRVFRDVEVKRTKHGAKCVVELFRSAEVESVAAWLKRDDELLAAASRKATGKRVALNLRPQRKGLRAGVYVVDVSAIDGDGEQYSKRVRLRVR